MAIKELKRVDNVDQFLDKWADTVARKIQREGLRTADVYRELFPLTEQDGAANKYTVYIEHNGGGDIEWPKHKNIEILETAWVDGTFDWAANFYSKPYSYAVVKVVAA